MPRVMVFRRDRRRVRPGSEAAVKEGYRSQLAPCCDMRRS